MLSLSSSLGYMKEISPGRKLVGPSSVKRHNEINRYGLFPIAWKLMIPRIQMEVDRHNHLVFVCLAPETTASHSMEAEKNIQKFKQPKSINRGMGTYIQA